MTFYVLDLSKRFAVHQGSEDSCHEYISTVCSLYGHRKAQYAVIEGSKNLKLEIMLLKKNNIPLF